MCPYDDYWYKSQDGLNLYARDYSPGRSPSHSPNYASPEYTREQDEVEPKVLLCIPGLTRNSADFAELAEHLSNRYRVIAVDLRGRGRSDFDSNPLNYHPATYAQDMVSLIKTLGVDSVTAIGTSLGGLVSMTLRAIQPDMLSAAVINDIGPEVEKEGMARIKDYVGKTPAVANWEQAIQVTRETLSHTYPKFSDEDWKTFTAKLYTEDADGTPVLDYDPDISVLVQQSPVDPPPDLWPLFEVIKTMPLLVLRGELSDVLSMQCVVQMQSIHPTMQFEEVPDIGHAPLLTEPEALTAIDSFLDSL